MVTILALTVFFVSFSSVSVIVFPSFLVFPISGLYLSHDRLLLDFYVLHDRTFHFNSAHFISVLNILSSFSVYVCNLSASFPVLIVYRIGLLNFATKILN